MRVVEIADELNQHVLGESIQELIRDAKRTQHGDRTNSLYNLLNDYHTEGGVWKHTLIGLQELPAIAKELSAAFQDPDYQRLYDEHVDDLRAAVLYHDIGKLVTQTPSKSRPGSYSFPKHSSEEFVQKAFDKYSIITSEFVRSLITHHHDNPADVQKLDDPDFVKLLIILKVADSISVGQKPISAGIEHIRPFVSVISDNQ